MYPIKLGASGFVLFIVMIFLLITSVVSLSSLSFINSSLHDINMHRQYQLYLRKAKSMLSQIGKEGIASYPCQIAIVNANTLLAAPVTWWQQQACYRTDENGVVYYYIVEFLGDDDCSLIENNQKAAYYRLTLFVMPSLVRIFLQSTIAIPVNGLSLCNEEKRHIQVGQQALREL